MPPRPPFKRFHSQQGQRKNIEYIPSPSSGAYVILVGMLKAKQIDMIEHMNRQQILDHGKKYSETGPKEDNKIWSSISSLINRQLINRNMTRDPLYFLTPQGEDLAKKLLAVTVGERTNCDDGLIPFNEDSQDNMFSSGNNNNNNEGYSQQASTTDTEETSNSCSNHVQINSDSTFELKAGTFEIVLIVDQREKIDIHFPDELMRKEMRSLSCADYIWIARPRGIAPYDRTKDLVLDYAIERKRLDDLQQSIFSGRFEEQKLRLSNLGVRRPIYLIEDYGQLRTNRLVASDLSKTITSILIRDGIEVEKVKNAQHANDYLISMTRCLQKFFLNLDLKSCDQMRLKSGQAEKNEFLTYAEFQSKGPKMKNFTVREMFAKHLVQITGMSGARAAVIARQYPTISALVDAYDNCSSEKEKENLLAKLQVPNSTKIGPALSKRVYAAYAMPVDDNENCEDHQQQVIG